ncbi:MAG TPA: hypothetical protein VK668_22895 [Mucilaginibacter sp.]|nr:hypothetical protein [Mucilaginibacter sp.]
MDYYFGLALFKEKVQKTRTRILVLAICMNLGILFFFKYFNFFIGSFNALSGAVGLHPSLSMLNIALPIGISFYTFHSLSYTIDIYHNKIKPTKNKELCSLCFFCLFFPAVGCRASIKGKKYAA